MATLDEIKLNYNYFYYLNNDYLDINQYTLKTNRGTASKEIDKEEYVIKNINNKNIICFKQLYKCYTYSLFVDQKVYSINNILYTDLYDILEKNKNSNKGIFSFVASKPVNNLENVGRCDSSMNGPSVFLREGDTGHGSGFNSNIVSSMGDLQRFQPVISIDGIGHIIYVELKNDNAEYFDLNENNMPKTARTISESLKQILEWSSLVEEPWNSKEEIALNANSFLKQINMTDSIKEELVVNQVDMQVARYIKGNYEARKRPPIEDISDISDVLRNWINGFFIYESLDDLFNNIKF